VGSHQRRSVQSRPFDNAGSVGWCAVCKKPRYLSRKAARTAQRQARSIGTGAVRVYECGGYWHWTTQDAATVTAYRERSQP
jgi:hypothetical protein